MSDTDGFRPRAPSQTTLITGCCPVAEQYGWINRALPADALGDFVRSLAHRIAGFPPSAHRVVKKRVNAIPLAPVEDFRCDADLFGEGVRNPESQSCIQAAIKLSFQPEMPKWPWLECWAT